MGRIPLHGEIVVNKAAEALKKDKMIIDLKQQLQRAKDANLRLRSLPRMKARIKTDAILHVLPGGFKVGETIFSLLSYASKSQKGKVVHVGMKGVVKGPSTRGPKYLVVEYVTPSGPYEMTTIPKKISRTRPEEPVKEEATEQGVKPFQRVLFSGDRVEVHAERCCHNCKGTGKKYFEKCKICGGTGTGPTYEWHPAKIVGESSKPGFYDIKYDESDDGPKLRRRIKKEILRRPRGKRRRLAHSPRVAAREVFGQKLGAASILERRRRLIGDSRDPPVLRRLLEEIQGLNGI